MNIDLGEKQVLTSYRKIATASWRHPRDPNTYAMLDLPVESAMKFLDTYSSETPLTLTHFVTKIKENLKVQQIVNPLPSFLLRPLLLIQEFLQFTLNISIPSLGMPKDRFGSAMITNIGALGIENAFIPLSPYARCPLLIGIGKPRKIPVVQDDNVIAANSVIITLTFDHRYADGAHGSHLMRRFKKIFMNPSAYKNVFSTEQ